MRCRSMRILINKQVENDLLLCKKKGWYRGIEDELSRLYRLLKTDLSLPGQAFVKHLGQEWGGKIQHARIALPKENCGGQNGGRIAYVILDDRCRILYIGGHKDRRYDNPHTLARMLVERTNDDTYLEWIG